MGWRFRKSINLGFGFRINLSKSGIGYSWGFPGYRITKMANGGNRITYSIPGTGIEYVEQSGPNSSTNSDDKLITGETKTFKNIPIDNIQKNDVILKKVNMARFLNKIANWSIVLSFFMCLNSWVGLLFVFGLVLKLFINNSYKIGLYYEFDDETRKMYNSLKESLITLSNSQKIWQVNSSTDVYNKKYNAGAGTNISRNNAFVTNKLPWYIKSNIEIFGLNLRREKVFFTPDRILVFRPFRKVFGCTYRDLNINIQTCSFIETERVQRDSEVISHAWRYANRDYSRDLRFSHNKQYPVCRYGQLIIKSPNGINTVIEFSNDKLVGKMKSNLVIFANTFNDILKNNKFVKGEQ